MDYEILPISEGGTGGPDIATAQANLGMGTAATMAINAFLQAVNNLSDIVSTATARSNLGLGTAATQAVSTFLQTANNLSDMANSPLARTNLGLGSSSTHPSTDFLSAINNLSDITNTATARVNLGLGNISTHNVSEFLQVNNNFSDLASIPTARTNLGITAADISAATSYSGGDITITSKSLQYATVQPLTIGIATSLTSPITIFNSFTFSSSGSKTVKLQKQNLTSANVSTRSVLANSNCPIVMIAYRISD